MIQFTLKCDQDHRFDSWFKSATAFDALAREGHITCAICGSGQVSKAIMAPRVSTGKGVTPPDTAPQETLPVLSKPQNDVEKAISALRQKVESSSDYVGTDFTKEARAMHAGETPERAIYGEARPEQARALIEEGVPLIPLPFRAKRSTQ